MVPVVLPNDKELRLREDELKRQNDICFKLRMPNNRRAPAGGLLHRRRERAVLQRQGGWPVGGKGRHGV